jgi:hypothetical protein
VQQVLIDQNQEETPEGNNASIYADIVIANKGHLQQANCYMDIQDCYMDIQDWPLGTKSQLTSQQTATITIPDIICVTP